MFSSYFEPMALSHRPSLGFINVLALTLVVAFTNSYSINAGYQGIAKRSNAKARVAWNEVTSADKTLYWI